MLLQLKTTALNLKRCYSQTKSSKLILEPLKQRSLIRVAGSEASEFLQGLITNDINHLGQSPGGSMYSMFLNTKGRVLYDTIIYRNADSDNYLIECDKAASNSLVKHLKLYRVRRKIDISPLENEYSVHALFSVNFHFDKLSEHYQKLEGIVVPCDKLKNTLPETSGRTKVYKDLTIFKDPRGMELGSRIISKIDANVKKELSEIVDNINDPTSDKNYKIFRYYLGLGEGTEDLPPQNCFPLECNCDYLHGVSFHKGCYIGQELTARTYHTGVVRKRLMPLYFSKLPKKLPKESTIIHEGVNLGKLRGLEGNVGLALLRISKALGFGEITIGDGLARVTKPSWWPTEVSKERINI